MKKFDNDVFLGLDPTYIYAAVDEDGAAYAYKTEPQYSSRMWHGSQPNEYWVGTGYDATYWHSSLIERESPAQVHTAVGTGYMPFSLELAKAGGLMRPSGDASSAPTYVFMGTLGHSLHTYDTRCNQKSTTLLSKASRDFTMAYKSVDEALVSLFPDGMELSFLDAARYQTIAGSLAGVEYEIEGRWIPKTARAIHPQYRYRVATRQPKVVDDYATVNGLRIKLGVKEPPTDGTPVVLAALSDSGITEPWDGGVTQLIALNRRIVFVGDNAEADAEALAFALSRCLVEAQVK